MTIQERTSVDITSRLRDLPDRAEAPYDWHEFKRRNFEHRGEQWHRTAIAASVVLVLAGIAGWMRYSAGDGLGLSGDSSIDEPAVALEGNPLPIVGYRIEPEDFAFSPAHGDAQEATSAWLANQPNEPAIVRVGNRLPVMDLEDRIAWIDDTLNAAQVESVQPASIQTLRHERAQLLSSLARVRYAETLAAER
jgi:hypothetical protein